MDAIVQQKLSQLNGNELTFHSMDDFITHAQSISSDHYNNNYSGVSDEWAGASFDEAFYMARHGWDEKRDDATEIATSIVRMVSKDTEHATFTPVRGVSGSLVDMGLFNSGVPECMIQPTLTTISRAGRVIFLCASVDYSGWHSRDQIIQRGMVVVALIMALQQTGHAVELWADATAISSYGVRARVRVQVKAANDTVDPAQIVYVFAHPSFTRKLMWKVDATLGSGGYDRPGDPIEDMPDGTIYIPAAHGMRDGQTMVRDKLKELGLLRDTN